MWDDIGKSSGGQDFLKVEAGSKVKLHVLSDEPYSFRQHFFNSLNRGAVCPGQDSCPACALKDKEHFARSQHAFVVVLEDGSIKVWNMGNRLGEQVKNIYDTYSGLADVDLVVSRVGTEKNTKWGVTPVPAKIDISGVDLAALPNLEELNPPAAPEDIEKMLAGVDPSTEFNPEELEAKPAEEAPAEDLPAEDEALPPPKVVAGRPAPKPAAPVQKGPTPQDQKAVVVKEIMILLSKSVKYKTLQARQALMKRVAPGKSTVGALQLPELIKLRAELKK